MRDFIIFRCSAQISFQQSEYNTRSGCDFCRPFINIVLLLFTGNEINLFLALLNLLPVFPLDGGRLLRLFLPNASKYISFVFLILMFAVSLYAAVYFNTYQPILICIYLLIFNMRYL